MEERPRRGLWRTDIVRAVLSGHSILGIAFASVIYVVCLSGALSVFLHDFERWEQPAAPRVTAVADAAVSRAVAEMVRASGAEATFYASLPTEDLPQLVLSTGGDADDVTWIADASGQLAVARRAPWAQFVRSLHTRLLMGSWGGFVVGLAGVALLSSLISGVLAHPRIFRDAFHLRLGGSRRLEQADLHNRLGVWPLPFHLLVTLTGALLGLSTVIVGVLAMLLFRGDTAKVYALLDTPPPAVDARPAAMPDVGALLATARARARDARPELVTISHWGRRDARIEVTSANPRLIARQDSVTFDAAGRIVAEERPANRTIGDEILGSLGELHFGWFGGLAVRLAYGALGLALCIVTSSGIGVWLARRRDKGRPAPLWERVWAAIVWGQPAIFAAAALASLFPATTSGGLGALWVVSTVASIVAAAGARLDGRRIALWGRIVTGAVLVLIAVEAATVGAAPGWLDVAVTAGGLVMLLAGRRRRPAARRSR